MALAALIAAYGIVDDGDALRATLPVAGHLLVEHQARQAAQAGARSIILLVERVPAPLAAAVDRLRRAGLAVDVARSVTDAADRIHPDERLLVVGDGIVADQRVVERIAAAAAPSVATVPDDPRHAAFERIDAATRWGGLLLTDGARLRQTAGMLGEWDLVSTLLRRTLQERPRQVDATAGVSLVHRTTVLDSVRERLVDTTRGHARSWPERFLFAPLEEVAVPRLLKLELDPVWVEALGVALGIIASGLLFMGWLAWGFGVLVLSLPVAAIAKRVARLRLDAVPRMVLRNRAHTGARLLALIGCARALSRSAGWGVWVLAVAIACALMALCAERLLLSRRGGPLPPIGLADADATILLGIPFALTGRWVLGLAACGLYAMVSLLVLQLQQLRATAPAQNRV